MMDGGKEQVKSILDDINGVGPARRKALMQHFKEIDKIKNATVEELTEVKGITMQVAEEIYILKAALENEIIIIWVCQVKCVQP